jgi:hypothetical protein
MPKSASLFDPAVPLQPINAVAESSFAIPDLSLPASAQSVESKFG